jgi:FkbM family methyltransferase
MTSAVSIDDLVGRWSESPRARNVLVPLLRAYIRYVPFGPGKDVLWSQVVEPYFAWHPRPFRARTIDGFSLEGDSRDLIQQWLYYAGVWEPALTSWIRRRLRPGDSIVDVGANIGYYALLGSMLVGRTGRVVAIEASPALCVNLRRNVELNGARNVRVINAAALGSRSTVRVYRGTECNRGETTTVQALGGEFECEVDAYPLQELLTPDEIQSMRVLKIDVEGAEHSILLAFDALDRLRPDVELIVEMHPQYLAHRGESVEAILERLGAAGFHPYVIDDEFWMPGYLRRGRRDIGSPRRLDREVEDGTVLIFSHVDARTLE